MQLMILIGQNKKHSSENFICVCVCVCVCLCVCVCKMVVEITKEIWEKWWH